jgi:hemolysin D
MISFPQTNTQPDQTIILKQSSRWSKAILWTIMGVTSFGITWACFAKIEQTIPATGQLKPEAQIQDVQTPVGGVVTQVHISDGEMVKPGDLLLSFDSTAAAANLKSLQQEKVALEQENQFYQLLLQANQSNIEIPPEIPQDIAQIGRSRTALVAENQLFQAQLGGISATLTPAQQARLRAIKAEFTSRSRAAQLESDQLQRQANQNNLQILNGRKELMTEEQKLRDIEKRNNTVIRNTQQNLASENKILQRIKPLAEEGAIATLQYDRQAQKVNNLEAELTEKQTTANLDLNSQRQVVETTKATLQQLQEEQKRLQLDIAQSREELNNNTALDETQLREQIANNENQIATIDSQLTQKLVENKKRLAQIASELKQAQLNLKYQEIRAQETGIIFDLQASKPGFVANPSEPLLKIVPDDGLVAEVFITNKDIGFVEVGMPVDVRIDTFKFSKYGDIKGKVVSIGKDALEPDKIHPFYRFPALIRLETQALSVGDRELLLQSGMSVNANIKIKENRRVISLITESLGDKIDSIKSID